MRSLRRRISSRRAPPILALNFLPADRPAPEGFYQFALSPEDEARQVARRMVAEGRTPRRGARSAGRLGHARACGVRAGAHGSRRRADRAARLRCGAAPTGQPRSRRCCASATATRVTGGWNPFSAASCSSSRAGAATSTSFSRRARPAQRAPAAPAAALPLRRRHCDLRDLRCLSSRTPWPTRTCKA